MPWWWLLRVPGRRFWERQARQTPPGRQHAIHCTVHAVHIQEDSTVASLERKLAQ